MVANYARILNICNHLLNPILYADGQESEPNAVMIYIYNRLIIIINGIQKKFMIVQNVKMQLNLSNMHYYFTCRSVDIFLKLYSFTSN